jgi:hypothetical protein
MVASFALVDTLKIAESGGEGYPILALESGVPGTTEPGAEAETPPGKLLSNSYIIGQLDLTQH